MLFPNQGTQGSFLFADLNKNSAALICLIFLLSPKVGIQLDMITAILNQAAMTALSNTDWSAYLDVVPQHTSNIQNHVGGTQSFNNADPDAIRVS